jgi:hypothetical protein
MKGLAHYIASLRQLGDNHLHGNLAGKRIAILGNAEESLIEAAIATGVDHVKVTGHAPIGSDPTRVTALAGAPFTACLPDVDVAFFDAREAMESDATRDVSALMDLMRNGLRPDATVFALLRMGMPNQHFDIFNNLVRTRSCVLPTQKYLFDTLLADCAIRMLDSIAGNDPDVHTRFLRLTLKKPSLLIVLGRGHSGKTSFARDLISLDPAIHVSNDYVYCELQRLVARGGQHSIPALVADQLGDGSGQACYLFNRQLENNEPLLRAYVELLIPLLPRDRRLVTMDLDLLEPRAVALLKTLLSDAGFSVWVAMR